MSLRAPPWRLGRARPSAPPGLYRCALLHRQLAALFRDFDVLLTPTTPHAAPVVETEYNAQGYDRWHDGVPYTLPFNLTGHPAASIPCGLTPSGLPYTPYSFEIVYVSCD